MDTSRVQFFNEILDLDHATIPLGKIAFFRERFRNRLHQLVLQKFLTLADARGFSRADLARRIGRRPEQVTRWLGAPGNWTLETVSDLLIGMGAVPVVEAENVLTLLESEEAAPEVEVRKPQTLEAMASPKSGLSVEQSPPISGATAAALGR